MKIIYTTVVLFPLVFNFCVAAEFHVSPSGNDADSGSEAAPVASFARAQQLARGVAGAEAVQVIFHAGTYYLNDTIRFDAADSGTETCPVTYRAASNETVVISGGDRLDGLSWTTHSGSILKTTVPTGTIIDQLFINNSLQPMARYPDYDSNTVIYNGYAADCIDPVRAAEWADPAGGFFHALHNNRWGGLNFKITGKNTENIISYIGGWQNNRGSSPHGTCRFVENIFEELDAPGEWFYDADSSTLYYEPLNGISPEGRIIETAGRLKHLVEFNGTTNAPVKYLNLQGLTFRHAARTFMEPYEPLLRSDWCIYRGGALFLEGTEDCEVLDCEFENLGGNAVLFSNYNRRSAIRGCHFHDIGASAVAFVGDPAAVRNPAYNYGERFSYNDIDQNSFGPQTENYPSDCMVEDCLMHDFGLVEKQVAGVQISMSSRITVRHCSIYRCPRAGINIGDGCWGGHIIEHCDVFDTVLETSDHGSFNSWGRERFWELADSPDDAELKRLSMLDAYQTIHIRNSRWRCDHGWDIDLDDGSSNYRIYNNLLLKGGLKLREGFYRTATNNIFKTNSVSLHVWYEHSGDIIERNILAGSYSPVRMPAAPWGENIDYNLFPSESNRLAYIAYGCDTNSLSGDPQFISADTGDYRVQETSPALDLGFVNFDMSTFGVQKESLKAIAEIPPEFKIYTISGPTEEAWFRWLGAQVKSVMTDVEASAFGSLAADGGVYFSDRYTGSTADGSGLLSDDLIQSINGTPVKTVQDMVAQLSAVDEDVTFGLMRGQSPTNIVVSGSILTDAGILALESGAFDVSTNGLAVERFEIDAGEVRGLGSITADSIELHGGTVTAGLIGSGGLTKSGAETVTLGGPLSLTSGTVISNGTLRFDGILTPPVRDGLVLRLDASELDSLQLDNGRVVQWSDADGGGVLAFQSDKSMQPTLETDALNDRPVVDFGPFVGGDSGRNMLFYSQSGDRTELNNIRSVFWLLRGANFLLGNTEAVPFHRGGDISSTAPIWSATYTAAAIKNGTTWLNGDPVDGTSTGLSDEYSLISLVTTGPVNADALCLDRSYRSGGQQIAEILVYDRALSDSERRKVESWLNRKWFGRGTPDMSHLMLAHAPLVISAGAALDLSGSTQTISTLSGEGTLTNSSSIRSVCTLDAEVDSGFGGTINGYFDLIKKGSAVQTLSGCSVETLRVSSGILALSAPGIGDLTTIDLETGGRLNLMHDQTDTVRSLSLTGITAANGLWGAPGNTNASYTSSLLTGTGLLLVPDLSPVAPTGLVATAGDGIVTLIWNANTEPDLAGYSVYRSAQSGSYDSALTNGLSSNDYVDHDVVNGSNYYYVVTATDANSNESAWSTEVSATPLVNQPPAFISALFEEAIATEGVAYSATIADNATDPESDSMTFSKLFGPDWLSIDSDGTLSGTPGTADVGLNSFNVQVLAIGGIDTATLEIQVNPAPTNNASVSYEFSTNGTFRHIANVSGTDLANGIATERNWTDGNFNSALTSDGLYGTGWSNNPKNTTADVRYKIDLGACFFITTVNSYAYDANAGTASAGDRAHQKFKLYGSTTDTTSFDETDPGVWTLIASVDTTNATGEYEIYSCTSITGIDASYRELMWVASPPAIVYTSQHTVWKEFDVFGSVALEGYDQWVATWNADIGTATNDPDADGFSNLYEYGLGGNPTSSAVSGTLPSFTRSGNGFLYIHPQRSDDTNLVYIVETRTNLVNGVWTNAGYAVTGTNVTGDTLNFVTNEVDTIQNEKFIRLKIER